jgi:hypothetical protein
MNATTDDAPVARTRVTPGATPQTPLRLLQTPRRPTLLRQASPLPQHDWRGRLALWWRAGR